MVIKGEIQTIDYNTNTCMVRMPFFENSTGEIAIAPAIFSVMPGSYNSYSVGDIVLLAFENGEVNMPVIIGKLFINTIDEKDASCGTINCVDLKVTNSAAIPLGTKLIYTKLDNVAEDKTGNTGYKTIADLITGINTIKDSIPKFPYTAICKNPVTNLYGHSNTGWSYVRGTSQNTSYYQIKYNNSTEINQDKCIEYMLYMTGVATLPLATHTTEYTEAILFTDGQVCYPEYKDNTLKLIIVD